MRVHWTNSAVIRRRLIHQYSAEDLPQSAFKVVDQVTVRSQQLNELPDSGRRIPEYDRNDVRELLEKPYRTIYNIKSD